MDGCGEPSLGLAFRVQSVGFGLADGPNNTSKGDIENRDTHGFMHWKKYEFAGQLFVRLISHVICNNPSGDDYDDQQGGQPVEGLATEP